MTDLRCYRCQTWPCCCKDRQTIICGDCREVLPLLEPVDLVLTDPPYGCGKAKWDTQFPTEWYPMARASSVAICTGSQGLRDSIRLVGDEFIDVLCLRNLNGMTRSAVGFCNWLAVVIARDCHVKNGWTATEFVIRGEQNSHPSQKPYDAWHKLVARLGGETVLDPFLGSGTTLRACKDLGRRGIGIEIERRYVDIACKRLEQEVLDFGEDT